MRFKALYQSTEGLFSEVKSPLLPDFNISSIRRRTGSEDTKKKKNRFRGVLQRSRTKQATQTKVFQKKATTQTDRVYNYQMFNQDMFDTDQQKDIARERNIAQQWEKDEVRNLENWEFQQRKKPPGKPPSYSQPDNERRPLTL